MNVGHWYVLKLWHFNYIWKYLWHCFLWANSIQSNFLDVSVPIIFAIPSPISLYQLGKFFSSENVFLWSKSHHIYLRFLRNKSSLIILISLYLWLKKRSGDLSPGCSFTSVHWPDRTRCQLMEVFMGERDQQAGLWSHQTLVLLYIWNLEGKLWRGNYFTVAICLLVSVTCDGLIASDFRHINYFT